MPPEPSPQTNTSSRPSQVKGFHGDEAESTLISNLKRGVVSLLQLQPHAGTAVEVGAEPGQDKTIKSVQINLYKDFCQVGFTLPSQQPNSREIPSSEAKLMLE